MRATAAEVRDRLRRFGLERDHLKAAVGRSVGIGQAEINALDYLHHLDEGGGLTPGQLGELTGLTSGAVTALADRLEKEGLITRSAHPTDRRSSVLRLTDAVRARGDTEFAGFAADVERIAGRLSPAEREVVARFLEECAGAAATHARERNARPPGHWRP